MLYLEYSKKLTSPRPKLICKFVKPKNKTAKGLIRFMYSCDLMTEDCFAVIYFWLIGISEYLLDYKCGFSGADLSDGSRIEVLADDVVVFLGKQSALLCREVMR